MPNMINYKDIVAAIDEAVLNWAGRPITLRFADGRTNTYRTLDELVAARKYYAQLIAGSKPIRQSIRLARLIPGRTI